MEVYGNMRCVTRDELVGSGLLSVPNYDKKVNEKKLKVVRPGRGAGNYALIDYDTMCPSIRAKFDRQFPNALKELNQIMQINVIHTDNVAVKFFHDYEPAIDMIRQSEYVLNAQVLNEMLTVESEMTQFQRSRGAHYRKMIWENVVATCDALREEYGHTLPTSEARLREKFREYKKNGYSALINKNQGNKHTRKINEREATFLLKLRRSQIPTYTEQQIFEKYNEEAIERGLKIIKSPTSVRNFFYSPEVLPLWFGKVYGMQKWKSKFASLQKTKMPEMANSLWYGDGTKLNLYYKDANGKMCTTQVYEVIDAATDYFIGYDIAPTECFDNQYRAFRMAVEVAGVRPYEIVTDNQGGQRKDAAKEWFKKIAVLARPTQAYNAQSKSIESAFGRFQQQVLHKIWHFTGQNITAKSLPSKPNMEFIMENQFALPTLEEVKRIYKECRDEWNSMPHHITGIARKDMYEMSDNPAAQPLQDGDIERMFYLFAPNSVTYTNYGLEFTLNKKKYHYDVYAGDGLRNEVWALKNTGRRFRVMYDPMDMTRIELWEITGNDKLKFSAMATPKVTIARATHERTEEQTSHMRLTIERNKEVMAAMQVDGEMFDLDQRIAAELFGLKSPKPKNVNAEKMKAVRAKMERGELVAPASLPGKRMQEEELVDASVAYASDGGYTKWESNITFDEISALERC